MPHQMHEKIFFHKKKVPFLLKRFTQIFPKVSLGYFVNGLYLILVSQVQYKYMYGTQIYNKIFYIRLCT